MSVFLLSLVLRHSSSRPLTSLRSYPFMSECPVVYSYCLVPSRDGPVSPPLPAGAGDLEPPLAAESFLPLEPLPSEADYSFGLDLSEGACDLFDFSF